jgi:hypothetical protein
MFINSVVDSAESQPFGTISLLHPAGFIGRSCGMAEALFEPDRIVGSARLDAAEFDPVRSSTTLQTRLICTWHREADGRLFCRWRQVSADELGALTIEPRSSSTDDPSFCFLRQEPRAQAIVRWFAIGTLLASAGLSSVVCLLGG